MTTRTYVPTLQKVAKQLCKYVVLGAPVIERQYPGNATLQAALATALAACQLLDVELEDVREYGD